MTHFTVTFLPRSVCNDYVPILNTLRKHKIRKITLTTCHCALQIYEGCFKINVKVVLCCINRAMCAQNHVVLTEHVTEQ